MWTTWLWSILAYFWFIPIGLFVAWRVMKKVDKKPNPEQPPNVPDDSIWPGTGRMTDW